MKCNDDSNYSFTKCIRSYINTKASCSLQWFSEERFPKCEIKEQFIRIMVENLLFYGFQTIFTIQDLLSEIKFLPEPNFTEKTGCYFKCEKIKG